MSTGEDYIDLNNWIADEFDRTRKRIKNIEVQIDLMITCLEQLKLESLSTIREEGE
jgi:hypothetical protein